MKDAMLMEQTKPSRRPVSDSIELPKITDYYKWAFEQAEHIRAGRFDQVDLLNVADEIESVGKSEYRDLASNLEIVLTHMLKWDNQPARRSRSWDASICEHRARVVDVLEDNPSLKTKRDEAVARAYRHARRVAARQTKLIPSRFPATCPYSWSDIMDKPYELEERN